ncbi:MAG: NADPH:quinone oxidoreductase family protein [Hyphomonadaceae bacterium]
MTQHKEMQALIVSALEDDFRGCAVRAAPVPMPKPGEALVRVRACGIGFPDLLMTRGAYQHKPDLPFIPGGDISGEIVALEGDGGEYSIGDSVVIGRLGNGMAEYVAQPIKDLRRKPERLSFEEAASVGSAYITAYVGLVRRAGVQPGEWVLVHGAAGGVGLAAVDLARVLGAKVIAASASDAKLAVIERLYAPDALVNVRDGFRDRVKEITGGRGADVIYDPVGGDVFDESTRCIAFDGRLLVIGFASGRIPTVSVNMPLIKGFSVVGVRAGEYGRKFPEKGREDRDAIWRLAAEGRIRPHVHAALPLSRWREGFEMMAGREIVGRVVLTA